MNVLQSNIHWADGNRDLLKAGKKVKEVVRGEG
jgi:hypothetical protein